MESSAISLFFSMLRRPSPEAPPEPKEYLINLIDSPGHIDFSSEVSTASRLCDGALVLVDAVEGVQSQTVSVLRHTWTEHLKPLLVINKVDRLITELKLSATEAYSHLSKLLEQVNAVIGTFFQGERMEEDLLWREKVERKVTAAAGRAAARTEGAGSTTFSSSAGDFEERDDEDLYFAPEKNNVIFGSAIDGWAFSTRQFAVLYEKKLGIKRSVLEKVLWGDYYLEPKTKRVLGSKHLKGRALKPMFVQLVLDNIWAVYNATTGGSNGKGDSAMLEKITTSLSLKIPSHILRSKDSRSVMTTIFSSWLPLSTTILVSTIEYLPSPPSSQELRLPLLLDASPGAIHIGPDIRQSVVNFRSTTNDPVVAFVSKMVAVRESELQTKKRDAGTMTGEEARELARRKRAEIERARMASQHEVDGDANGITDAIDSLDFEDSKANAHDEPEDPERLIGFARLYSGTLAVGDTIYVLPPKFSPANPHDAPEPKKVTVTGLYLFMGRSLEALTRVPAGNVCGIAGLEGSVLKNATLCTTLEGAVNLAGVSMGNQPIVRVALEPANPSDLEKMIYGMKLLEQSDPCARYELLETGEHVILTAGELHLERCLKDLRERFAKCDIQAGEPIVPYRETIVSDLEMASPKSKDKPRGSVESAIFPQITVSFRTVPLPKQVTDFLVQNATIIRQLYSQKNASEGGEGHQGQHGNVDGSENEFEGLEQDPEQSVGLASVLEFRQKLQEAFSDSEKQGGEIWKGIVEKITSFGPRRSGSNLLIDLTPEAACEKL